MKCALVTGGTGLVGSNLVHALANDGVRVRVLCRKGSDRRGLGGVDAEIIEGDIRDPRSVIGAIQGCDTVFHTAAIISYWQKERDVMTDVNVRGTATVVEACLQANIEKLVHTSSIATIGPTANDSVMTEETPFDPEKGTSGYRTSKKAAEEIVIEAARKGLPAVVVNPSVIMGRRDYKVHGGRIIRDVVRKRIFYAPTGGTNIVGVDDVVAGHIAAARMGRIGERYLLVGENRSFMDIFRIVAEECGGIAPRFTVPGPVVRSVALVAEGIAGGFGVRPWVTRELVAGTGRHRRYCGEKAVRELGFTPRSLRATVRESFEWLKQADLL